MHKSFIVLIIVSILGLGCKKKVPDATVDNSVVTISFHSPVNGDVWAKGSETHVEALIDADAMMGGWSSLILNGDKSDTIERYTEYYEQTQYLVHHHWVSSMNTPDTLTVVVRALDKSGNVLKEESTTVKCL